MNRLLCAIALAGFACAAGAQSADARGSARPFAAQDELAIALQPRPVNARSFNDVLADGAGTTSQADSQIAAGVTPAIPEPQTYALLLAGLGAVVFVAVRRRRP